MQNEKERKNIVEEEGGCFATFETKLIAQISSRSDSYIFFRKLPLKRRVVEFILVKVLLLWKQIMEEMVVEKVKL